LPGDYNASGTVDAADYVVWRKTLASQVIAYSGADGSGNGVVDPADHDLWKANFGRSLAEAASAIELIAASVPALPVAAVPSAHEHAATDATLRQLASLPADVVFTMLGDSTAAGGSMFARGKVPDRAPASNAALVNMRLLARPPCDIPRATNKVPPPAQVDWEIEKPQRESARESTDEWACAAHEACATMPLQIELPLRDASGRASRSG
jgi:hypothetical protein